MNICLASQINCILLMEKSLSCLKNVRQLLVPIIGTLLESKNVQSYMNAKLYACMHKDTKMQTHWHTKPHTSVPHKLGTLTERLLLWWQSVYVTSGTCSVVPVWIAPLLTWLGPQHKYLHTNHTSYITTPHTYVTRFAKTRHNGAY